MRFLLLSVFSSLPLAAASRPSEIRVCIEDKPVFPLYGSPGLEDSPTPGILIDFTRQVMKKNGVRLKIVRRAPSACRILMKIGSVDAYGIISHIPHREDWAVYPRKTDGSLNLDAAFKRTGYILYGQEDQKLPWDGIELGSLKGLRIGSLEGHPINSDLMRAGALVEVFKSLSAMQQGLLDKQLDGIALHSNRSDLRVGQGIRRYDSPLKMNDYYFTFSKGFFQNHKELCENVWKDAALYETSDEGRKLMTRYEALENFPPAD